VSLYIFAIGAHTYFGVNQASKECRAGLRVHLTVNSFANDTVSNRVELNWAGASPQDGDWIGLFASNPVTSGVDSPVERFNLSSATASEGFFITDTMDKNYVTNSSELGFVAKCLGIQHLF
jgi:hypothetical protein